MDTRKVVVIGAGIGGLATAMELAARGLDVTVCERAAGPGGKMREVAVGDARIDGGPTVFTMRWVFEELFERCGLTWPAHLNLTPVQVLARHAWLQGGRLDLYSDPERTAQDIGTLSGAGEARRYLAFTRRARGIYQGLEDAFIRAARPSPLSVAGKAGLQGLGELARLAPYATLWRALGQYFHDTRLRQLFGRYATYVGSSPFHAPATLMLVAHVERDGVWLVDGGMFRLARTLADCAADLGACLRWSEHASEITVSNARVTGVRLATGEHLPANAVVCNGDVSAVATGQLGDGVRGAVSATPVQRRSLSAVTWSLVAPTEGFPLVRHNVFFSDDYAAEFDDVFNARRLPTTPTVYVCAQDRGDGLAGEDAAMPAGGERLMCLVNAPATGDEPGLSPRAIAECEQRTFQVLERCGMRIGRDPRRMQTTTPQDFHRLFPATGGALYGAACHGWKAPFARPGARSRVPGLYLTGGGVHPGPGVPMAALSGHIAASCVLADLDVT